YGVLRKWFESGLDGIHFSYGPGPYDASKMRSVALLPSLQLHLADDANFQIFNLWHRAPSDQLTSDFKATLLKLLNMETCFTNLDKDQCRTLPDWSPSTTGAADIFGSSERYASFIT